jgi:hypothetical protein
MNKNTKIVTVEYEDPARVFSEFKGWRVRRANLQTAYQVPHGGGSTVALYSEPGTGIGHSATVGVLMKFDGAVLMCEYKGSVFNIPAANVIGVLL